MLMVADGEEAVLLKDDLAADLLHAHQIMTMLGGTTKEDLEKIDYLIRTFVPPEMDTVHYFQLRDSGAFIRKDKIK